VVERELAGGECSYWACIPSKTLLHPGEAVQAARDATATAQLDVDAALAWREFMVSDHSDAGQQRWLADRGIHLLRGSARLAGPGVVEVDGVRHTADHVVLANGADPFVPPIPGLRELDGTWTSHEVTGMKAVPRRMLVLGGGPVGVEMAQAVRRLGGEVALVEMMGHVLPREPAPLGTALGEVLHRRRHRPVGQATLAIRAHVPLEVLTDTIQPFPTFSEVLASALKALRSSITADQQTLGRRPRARLSRAAPRAVPPGSRRESP